MAILVSKVIGYVEFGFVSDSVCIRFGTIKKYLWLNFFFFFRVDS